MTVRSGAIGVVITLTVEEDGAVMNLSSATMKNIDLRQPNGDVVTYPASFVTNGTDGKVTATTADGDLDQLGRYHASAHLTISGWTDHSSRLSFNVELP
jgi:hypothetical protein